MDKTRFSLLVYLGFFYLVVSTVLRCVLFFSFGLHADVSYLQLPGILGLGLVNDVIESLYLLLPFSLYLLLIPQKIYQQPWHRWLSCLVVAAVCFVMLYLAVVQFYFFQEYSARFNLVSVDYLIYPNEVFTNIWDAYPVVKVLIAVSAVTLLLIVSGWRWLNKTFFYVTSFSKRAVFFAANLVLVLVAYFAFNTHSFDFTDNRITHELTANGYSSFFQAFHTNKLNYDNYYYTNDRQQALALLTQDLAKGGGEFTQLAQQKINRLHAGNKHGLGKLNVVVIVDESFGAEFNGAYQHKKDYTPNFDRLAKHGILFKNMYATGTRTVRGLEAVTASFPPIPSESIIKRPGSEHIANWGEIMKQHGYTATFIYGGYGLFDNMNHFYSNNGFRIRDRSDIKKITFSNIWGVCDGDLFNYTLGYLSRLAKTKKPFFTIIMTTSNHKPFTYPAGIAGVKATGGGRSSGVRYTDYAIGQFIAQAKKHPWFNNTVFVIVADHDARVYGSAEIPVYSYRIPLLIYSPHHIAARTVSVPTSQLDIAPTVLGLLGLRYEAPFFGQDVLHWNPATPKIILINHDHDVALMQGNKLVVLSLLKKVRTYLYDPVTKKLSRTKDDDKMKDLAAAYYQEAYYLFKEHKYTF